MLSRCDCIAILHGPRVMMKKKSVERKWVVMAVAVYSVIMVDLVPSPANASLLPAQHLPDAPGNTYHRSSSSSSLMARKFAFSI